MAEAGFHGARALRTWLDLPRSRSHRAIAGRHRKRGLHRPRLSAIIMSSRLPASHPDCRAVPVQIVALQITWTGPIMFIVGTYQWQGGWAALAAFGLVLFLMVLHEKLRDEIGKAD